MDENKSFEDIMKEITHGLTGDPASDMKYLEEQGEKYKDHEYSKEITRACGRLMYELIPDDTKEEIGRLIDNDNKGFEAALEEVRFNHYEKNFGKALKLIENMVRKYETWNMYADDAVSEYHTFREPMQEIIYEYIAQPQKELRRAQVDYSEMYFQYGSLLFEFKRWEDAEAALAKAMRWNPTYARVAFEHAETFKVRGMIDEFKDLTMDIFRYAYRPDDVAHCYRNLAYYYVEKKEYKPAVCCLLFSNQYEKNQVAMSELYYISQQTGEIYDPTAEELHAVFEVYEIPYAPDVEILKLAYGYGKHFYDNGDMHSAVYFLEIVTWFHEDADLMEMFEDARSKIGS